MASKQVSDYLLERLREWGVDNVFAYPGDGINGIDAAWARADNKPKFIQARHEEMAAFEAVGYAKFSGRLGVCMATSGPAPSTCSTGSTTPSSTTCRWWPSSGRPTAAPWVGPTSRRSTC
jgi:thiamine pyrophosphate-dependent acetolactate synthase large subunit-like protein